MQVTCRSILNGPLTRAVQERLPVCFENPEIPGRIQMERFIPVEIFRKKSNTFRDITLLPFLPKRPRFSVPFVWITSARLHVQRKRKLYRYFVNGTTQSRSCFRCPKKYQYHLTEIFHRNFRANGKRSRSSVRDRLVHCAVYLFACYITSLIIHLTQ